MNPYEVHWLRDAEHALALIWVVARDRSDRHGGAARVDDPARQRLARRHDRPGHDQRMRSDDRAVHHRGGIGDEHAVAERARMDEAEAAHRYVITDDCLVSALGNVDRRPRSEKSVCPDADRLAVGAQRRVVPEHEPRSDARAPGHHGGRREHGRLAERGLEFEIGTAHRDRDTSA